jgi:DNA-binding NtrC family response regulator
MKKVKLSFNISDLQNIIQACTILRACSGIQPFQLANTINACKVAADTAIKAYQDEFDLIKERSTDSDAKEQCENDYKELIKKKFESEYPELKEAQFATLEIIGDKEVPQQDGSIKKFNYRDAYFSLLGLVIVN